MMMMMMVVVLLFKSAQSRAMSGEFKFCFHYTQRLQMKSSRGAKAKRQMKTQK